MILIQLSLGKPKGGKYGCSRRESTSKGLRRKINTFLCLWDKLEGPIFTIKDRYIDEMFIFIIFIIFLYVKFFYFYIGLHIFYLHLYSHARISSLMIRSLSVKMPLLFNSQGGTAGHT